MCALPNPGSTGDIPNYQQVDFTKCARRTQERFPIPRIPRDGTGYQTIGDYCGEITAMSKPHWVGLFDPSWERELDLKYLERQSSNIHPAHSPPGESPPPKNCAGALPKYQLQHCGRYLKVWPIRRSVIRALFRPHPSRSLAPTLPRFLPPKRKVSICVFLAQGS